MYTRLVILRESENFKWITVQIKNKQLICRTLFTINYSGNNVLFQQETNIKAFGSVGTYKLV